jgi:hypothetical protein
MRQVNRPDDVASAAGHPELHGAARAGVSISPRARPELVVDTFIESYVYWREACANASAAYGHWASCRPTARALAFESYRAAADWEEHAARVHATWADRLHAFAQRETP